MTQGDPGLPSSTSEYTILETREKLPGVCMACIVIVLLAMIGSNAEKETWHGETFSPMLLTTVSVTVHGGQEIGTVGVRVTVVGGSVSFMRIIPSTILSYIQHPRTYRYHILQNSVNYGGVTKPCTPNKQ